MVTVLGITWARVVRRRRYQTLLTRGLRLTLSTRESIQLQLGASCPQVLVSLHLLAGYIPLNQILTMYHKPWPAVNRPQFPSLRHSPSNTWLWTTEDLITENESPKGNNKGVKEPSQSVIRPLYWLGHTSSSVHWPGFCIQHTPLSPVQKCLLWHPIRGDRS